jgi:hypothetical protein
MTLEDLPDTVRNRPVACEIRGDEDRTGTQAFRPYGWHGGMNSEGSGLVGSGTNDRTFALPGNDHGFAAQLRIIPLLDRSVERVHVDMDDFSHD